VQANRQVCSTYHKTVAYRSDFRLANSRYEMTSAEKLAVIIQISVGK